MSNMPTAASQKSTCAFVASSFGFGPVSKAVTIAKEIKSRFPKIEISFFGNGIARQFAEQSKVFDFLIEADVDESDKLIKFVPQLQKFEFVFSVINLPLLQLWQKSFGKLFFVDSLAWMWKQPPAGIENAEIYFMQDYLVSPERIQKWKKTCQINLVPPIGILPSDESSKTLIKSRTNRLLVNFSGCSNHFVHPQIYDTYTKTLLKLILEEAADNFELIEVCVNQQMAKKLKKIFTGEFLSISQLPHKTFLDKLADSRFLLTAPGITTTLESIAVNTPLGFLLPQNDSQAIMSELYRRQINESLTMAFSRFGKNLAFPLSLDNFRNLKQPVELAIERMSVILENHKDELKYFLAEMLGNITNNTSLNLKNNIQRTWNKTGQAMIAEYVFG